MTSRSNPSRKSPSLLARLLFRFSGLLRCRIILSNQDEPYLERYHLLRLPGGGGIYLHRFLASDPDRGLHDHPWDRAFGLVLTGGYKELRLAPQGDGEKIVEQRLGPGSINNIRGDDFHRIVLPDAREAWTLFGHTRKYKDWGFVNLDAAGQRHYQPHEDVTHEPDHAHWWQSAPRGRHAAREPLKSA
jgi:hypothetical protein